MTNELNLFNIYEQNLNFLIGAGASNGFLPTLALKIKDAEGNKLTFESLAKAYEDDKEIKTLLFMLYYQQCIKPGLPKNLPSGIPVPPRVPQKESVIKEYKRFLTTLVRVLDRQKPSAKRANIFTTNYDNCFETASEELLAERKAQFIVNDGSTGFQKRTFHTRNFNHRVVNRGIFERHDQYIPQINILHAHGSVNWGKGIKDGEIEVSYGDSNYAINLDENEIEVINVFKDILYDESKTIEDLINFKRNTDMSSLKGEEFWNGYNKIPIVNPTKWKFHETIFEEAYYQILRHLSYELERPHSVLITFGFSFADEHILSLIQRSLSNPSLTMYVSCFNDAELEWMKTTFKEYPNVRFINAEHGVLDFTNFNDTQFSLNRTEKKQVEGRADEVVEIGDNQ
jgi:hypothetical protein